MIYSFVSLAEKNNNPKQNKKGCENLLMIVSSFLSQHEPRTNANWYIGFIIFISRGWNYALNFSIYNAIVPD